MADSLGIKASVVNGELQYDVNKTTNNSSINNENKKKSQNMVDEDMFLQLLVAEMQYQDPLEPTSNTEYVSELASFTQVSALQDMKSSMDDINANSLVGQYVTILTDEGDEISGLVDYVTQKDGETMVSIDDELYNVKNVNDVFNGTYYEAITTAGTFHEMMAKLPSESELSVSDRDDLEKALTVYNSMTDYTLQFVAEDDVKKIETLVARLNSLLAPADNNSDGDEEDEISEAAEEVAGTEAAETIAEDGMDETSGAADETESAGETVTTE